MTENQDYFIEINYAQRFKNKMRVSGDTFISKKIKESRRIINVLSDGLGSGIKANVLSTLTASMALKYAAADRDLSKAAKTIMRTLPVDAVRKISYSTFTILDIDYLGRCHVIEYDNPPYVLIRNGESIEIPKQIIKGEIEDHRDYELHLSELQMAVGDKLVFFSDGVTQSGIGTNRYPFGWGQENIIDFLKYQYNRDKTISARKLAARVVEHAFANCNYKATDDITCGVINIRKPRKLLVLTGPSVKEENDSFMAQHLENYRGKTAICGGTTTQIIARELKRKFVVDIDSLDPEVPCCSTMPGVDLVAEGMLTLGKAMEILEKGCPEEEMQRNHGAVKLINLFLESDIIEFMVGTKINEVHQDPNMPIELGIRRNTMKSLARILDEKYLKETSIHFL